MLIKPNVRTNKVYSSLSEALSTLEEPFRYSHLNLVDSFAGLDDEDETVFVGDFTIQDPESLVHSVYHCVIRAHYVGSDRFDYEYFFTLELV